MYARVVRWEGMDQEAIRQFTELIKSSEGPPEGVPSSGIMVLGDPQNNRSRGGRKARAEGFSKWRRRADFVPAFGELPHAVYPGLWPEGIPPAARSSRVEPL